jgi:hypothetical protein
VNTGRISQAKSAIWQQTTMESLNWSQINCVAFSGRMRAWQPEKKMLRNESTALAQLQPRPNKLINPPLSLETEKDESTEAIFSEGSSAKNSHVRGWQAVPLHRPHNLYLVDSNPLYNYARS